MAAVILLVAIAARHRTNLRPYHWIPIYGALHTGYYVVFMTPELRYLYPVLILMAFYAAVAVKQVSFARIGRASIGMLCIALAAGVSAFHHGYGVTRSHSLHPGLYAQVAPWLNAHTEPHATIGGFNSGIVSYYSGRRVVNLDGVMNDAAINAIQTRTLGRFIDGEHIDYLADVDSEISKFMDRYAGDPAWRSKWLEVYRYNAPNKTPLVVLQRRSVTGSPTAFRRTEPASRRIAW